MTAVAIEVLAFLTGWFAREAWARRQWRKQMADIGPAQRRSR